MMWIELPSGNWVNLDHVAFIENPHNESEIQVQFAHNVADWPDGAIPFTREDAEAIITALRSVEIHYREAP